ncbi:MAG TPA: hypothetical protein VER39_06945 [Nocardioidaceae bacterium]|nr:hypothetical protein [Nocardioidaceae bacterium]
MTALAASAATATFLVSAAGPFSSADAGEERRDRAPTSSAPARADDTVYNLVDVRGSNVRVTSRDCRDVEVRVRYGNPFDSDHGLTAEIEVWKERAFQDQAFLYANAGNVAGPSLQARGRYLWCPDQGLGRFRLGPSKVVGNSYSGETDDVTFEDPTIGSFTARRHSRTFMRLTRTGDAPRRVRVAAVVATYTLRTATYERWRDRVLRIQRRNADGWTTVGSARTDGRGVAKRVLTAPVGAVYRVRAVGTRDVWGSTSPSRVVPRS